MKEILLSAIFLVITNGCARKESTTQALYKTQAQITYLNCHIKNKNELEACYRAHKFDAPLSSVKSEISTINQKILNEIFEELNSFAQKRNEYCEKNSTLSFKNCLTYYLEKESVALTNILQKKYERFSGVEYLYIKNMTLETYANLLYQYEQKNFFKEEKNIAAIIEKHFPYIEKKLSEDKSWITETKFLPASHLYCKNFGETYLKPFIKNDLVDALKDHESLNEKCDELLSKEEIISSINEETNKALEEESKKIHQYITTQDSLEEGILKWEKSQKPDSFLLKNKDLVLKYYKFQTRDIASKP